MEEISSLMMFKCYLKILVVNMFELYMVISYLSRFNVQLNDELS